MFTNAWNNEILWQHKKINKQEKWENVPSLELFEVVFVQCNLEDNQYQQKVWSIIYLLNDEPCNVVFLKTYNTDFDGIIITFTDPNGRPLEIEGKVNLILLINK